LDKDKIESIINKMVAVVEDEVRSELSPYGGGEITNVLSNNNSLEYAFRKIAKEWLIDINDNLEDEKNRLDQ
jgi:hypothetical protein